MGQDAILPYGGAVVIIWGLFATLAQLAEHSLRKREVKGSSPLGGFLGSRVFDTRLFLCRVVLEWGEGK